MSRMLIQTRPFSPAGGNACRSLFSQPELQEERDGGGSTGVKELCAALDVHDCAQDMANKEVRGDSCALSIFNRLTKELQDGLK